MCLRFDASFFGYFDEIIPERGIHALVVVFVGPGGGTPTAGPGEVTELRWFSLAEARAQRLAFQHAEILERYAAWRRAGS